MIRNRRSTAAYRVIADQIIDRIRDGDYAPGGNIPSADLICRIYGVGMATANKVLDTLKAEGWTETVPGRPQRVRVQPEQETAWLQQGARVTVRWPTPQEAELLEIPDRVQVLVVSRQGCDDEVYPGDRWQLIVGAPATEE
jgi:DNA-binding FadR family transcriptional regulator